MIRDDSTQAQLLLHTRRSTMAATLENAAKNLLSDPPWMRVFKNTYDSIEDQLNKVDERLQKIKQDLVGINLVGPCKSQLCISDQNTWYYHF